MNLNKRKMHVVRTAPNGVVGRDTIFDFSQEGTVVTATYSGGRIRVGYLVGLMEDAALSFRYCQISDDGRIDGGSSSARIEAMDGGKVRLVESFRWDSKDGSGENIIEEIGDTLPTHPPDATR